MEFEQNKKIIPFTLKIYRVKAFDKKLKQLKDITILVMYHELSGQNKIIESKDLHMYKKSKEDHKLEVPVSKDKKLIEQNMVLSEHVFKSAKLIRYEYYEQQA